MFHLAAQIRPLRSSPWWAHLAALLLLLAAGPLAARDADFQSAVNDQVRAARRVAPELGVLVAEVESGETVYGFNPETQRIIASNTKLFTTAAALDRLGPAYFFETKILLEGTVQDGALVGRLAIIGGGDPTISGRFYYDDPLGPLRSWAKALRYIGIERIRGDIVLVHGFFDRQLVHPDWPRDQLTRWYEAPVSALSFGDNCVLMQVRPGARAGQPAAASTIPSLSLFRLDNNARTTGDRRGSNLSFGRPATTPHVLTVNGWIDRRTEKVLHPLTVADPLDFFAAAFQQALAEEGITVEGTSRFAATLPAGSFRTFLTFRTDLLTVLEVANKRSQNFFAESLIKLLGAERCGAGSWEAGQRVMAEFLDEIGIPPGTYSQADGSGMSRNNRFSPAQIIRLLGAMYHHRWGPEYLRTLPYSGEVGLRWARRLASPPYRGNVLAKTGALRAVSSLSGYAKARSGTLYAFSILMNGGGGGDAAHAAQDRIVRAVVDHG